MINKRYKQLILTTLSVLMLDSGTSAVAAGNFSGDTGENFDAFFNQEQSLNNEELDEMRGGFLTSNGVVIDFSFSASTLVDGQLINQVVLNTANTSLTDMPSLRNIIQIGEDNTAFSSSTIDIDTLPNILTVIQNNLDDLTIQQVNLLDLSIQNFDSYIQQAVAPEIDFQNTFRIVP